MRRTTVLALVTASWTALVGCEPTGIVIRPYVQNIGKTEATVMWTSGRAGDFDLAYGAGDALDRSARTWACRQVEFIVPTGTDPKVGPTRTECVYEARLTGLTPGTSYAYRVNGPGGPIGGSFRTAPDRTVPFTFVMYGDSRTDIDAHNRVARAIASHKPAFVIHSGDLTSRGIFAQYKPEFFGPLADVIDDAPIWPVLGNHEGDQSAYRQLLCLPGNERWYSFDYANAHFVALDSTAGPSNRPEMLAWLDKDLGSSKADWKIVFYHHPSYDITPRHTAWGREEFLPLFRKHKVDLVVAGHSHGYQRLRPMFTPGENDSNPITFMVAAGGGASLHSMERNPAAVVGLREYHYVLVDVDGQTLSARTLTPEGKQIDAFRIVKRDGKPDAEYLALAMPESEFDKLRDLIIVHLRGITLPALPQPGQPPVKVSFPVGAGEHAMDFKLRLEGRGHYRMSPPEVTGRSPANGTTDVTVAIGARGKTDVRGSALDPAVNFIIEYRIGQTDGLIYGGSLRFRPDGAPADPDEDY